MVRRRSKEKAQGEKAGAYFYDYSAFGGSNRADSNGGIQFNTAKKQQFTTG